MPFNTYDRLQEAILNWIGRPDDPAVAPSVPEFITLFEEEARDRLKTRFNEIQHLLLGSSAENGRFALPDDFWSVRQVTFGDGTPLEYMPPQDMTRRFGTIVTQALTLDEIDSLGNLDTLTDSFDDQDAYSLINGTLPSGRPRYYTIEGPEMRIAPPPASTTIPLPLQLDYEQGVPALGPRVQTNWLLKRYPSLYLYGSLSKAEAFIDNDERVPAWISVTEAAFERVRMADVKARVGGAPLRVRVDSPTP